MGLIPQNYLDDILARVDIVEVISGYIPLKKAGRNFKANCPFHHEKTPSFMVSPEKQIYRCFGCGESGNAFKFLMRYERLDFLEAVEILARKAGVQLPQSKPQDYKTVGLATRLFQVNEIASSFFFSKLRSSQGDTARAYLLKRGLKEETIEFFKIGYAPAAWDGLISYFRSKGISLSLLEKAGLILTKETGGYYDRFRNRIIFPVVDIKERVMGFGARVLDNTLPKYINSPETPIYTKGRNLFGLWAAKDAIRQADRVVIVEGYLDCIVPFQFGVHNIVASLGTALTVEQVRLLKRYTNNVVVVFDGDKAGELASLRSLEIFIEEGMDVGIVSLPSGFDPDSFVQRYGIEEFKKMILAPEGFFDYKLKNLVRNNSLDKPSGKARIVNEMLVTISKFKNAILKSEYVKRLAEQLDVKEDALFLELNKVKPDYHYRATNSNECQKLSCNPTELLLLRIILQQPKLINEVKSGLSISDLQDTDIGTVLEYIFKLSAEGRTIEPSSLLNHFSEERIARIICECSLSQGDELEDKERILKDCLRRIKAQGIRLRRRLLHEKIKAAQIAGDEELVRNLMQEFHELVKSDLSTSGVLS